MTPIDIERCLRASQDIWVEGHVGNSGARQKAIEDAIAAIQQDGKAALAWEYIGVKNYAEFGDQREDHRYGYGPRHGTIVFSIRRRHTDHAVELGADHIYLLECCRDCPTAFFVEDDTRPHLRGRRRSWTLCEALAEQERCRFRAVAMLDAVRELTVDSAVSPEGLAEEGAADAVG